MSSSPIVLRTDRYQVATHGAIIGIGESLRRHYDDLAEEKRQRTIRSVEEVVRREESSKAEKQLTTAKTEWKKERQQLFQEAHQNQLRAIARQSSLLEEKLRKEFACTLKQTAQEHKRHLEREIENTWEKAELVKAEAVEKTRLDERDLAREEALIVAERFAKERQHDSELAFEERQAALHQQKEHLDRECTNALACQKATQDQEFEERLANVSQEYESRLAELQSKLDEQLAISQQLESELQATTESRNLWESKYKNIKTEFSDFIDQIPGFRGEFVLQ